MQKYETLYILSTQKWNVGQVLNVLFMTWIRTVEVPGTRASLQFVTFLGCLSWNDTSMKIYWFSGLWLVSCWQSCVLIGWYIQLAYLSNHQDTRTMPRDHVSMSRFLKIFHAAWYLLFTTQLAMTPHAPGLWHGS